MWPILEEVERDGMIFVKVAWTNDISELVVIGSRAGTDFERDTGAFVDVEINVEGDVVSTSSVGLVCGV